jgi:hypothetical protein
MTRADRIVDVRPDANLPPWSLFVTDDVGQAVAYGAATAFSVKVRTAATVVTVAGSMTAAAAASVDTDQPTDVPTFRFTPTAASLASVPAVAAPATILVYVGTGNVYRHEFPARVVP